MDPDNARHALLADRAATQARLETLIADLDGVIAAAADSNLDDEHDPEGATIAFERQQVVALIAQARGHLEEVDGALARISAGTYGICAGCGGPIGDERLLARPFALRCLACAGSTPRQSR